LFLVVCSIKPAFHDINTDLPDTPASLPLTREDVGVGVAFHDTYTNILARILTNTSDMRDQFPEVIPVAS